jgi:hypothetical protein
MGGGKSPTRSIESIDVWAHSNDPSIDSAPDHPEIPTPSSSDACSWSYQCEINFTDEGATDLGETEEAVSERFPVVLPKRFHSWFRIGVVGIDKNLQGINAGYFISLPSDRTAKSSSTRAWINEFRRNNELFDQLVLQRVPHISIGRGIAGAVCHACKDDFSKFGISPSSDILP